MPSSCASLDSGEVPALGSELDWGIGMDANIPCLAVVNDSRNELMASSSGGVFSILARHVLGEGGVVYGHAFTEGLHVKCVRVDSIEGLDCLRGSKYVQSDMGDAMRGVRDDLRSGAPVLFSGTPCQVDGLLSFLDGGHDNLLTVDIVCHGVPSWEFFKDCIDAEFAGRDLVELRFRDKREGWGCGGGGTVLHNQKKKDVPFAPEVSYYYKRFLAGDVYRESCYRCPYAGGERPGDLTIGDFWGIDSADAGLDPRRGISLVLANSHKGRELLPVIKKSSTWAERDALEAITGNDQLRHPTPRPKERDAILKRWRERGIESLEDQYRRETGHSAMRWRVLRLLKRVLSPLLRRED